MSLSPTVILNFFFHLFFQSAMAGVKEKGHKSKISLIMSEMCLHTLIKSLPRTQEYQYSCLAILW